jgi:NAD(P)-dependent dehydrogenase (short-subunit alcohol dehydrogenase family)
VNNKVAIVTGSSKGIGKAIEIALARSKEYSGIVVNARRAEEAQNVSKEIMDSYSKWCSSLAVEAEVSKESDCIRHIHETVDRFGRIDVLVNNAGVQEDIPFTETTVEEWYKIIGVDLTGPFVRSREAVKQMQKQVNPAVLRRIPVGRVGRSEEVANVVEFLASPKTSYVTGTFLVDGGMTLYPSFGENLDRH